MRRRLFLVVVSALLLTRAGICSPTHPHFSGSWKQSNERCTPRRTGDVILHIEHHDPAINVETTAQRSSGPTRHAVQSYTTDGKISTSRGQTAMSFIHPSFGTAIALSSPLKEHEDGRIILSRERWTLMENDSVLERVREGGKASGDAGKQILVYTRGSITNPIDRHTLNRIQKGGS